TLKAFREPLFPALLVQPVGIEPPPGTVRTALGAVLAPSPVAILRQARAALPAMIGIVLKLIQSHCAAFLAMPPQARSAGRGDSRRGCSSAPGPCGAPDSARTASRSARRCASYDA